MKALLMIEGQTLWWCFVPEDPVGGSLKQFGREDVSERCYRSCTICTPKKKEKTQMWVSRKSTPTLESYFPNAVYFQGERNTKYKYLVFI